MTDQRADDMDFVRAWNEALPDCRNANAIAERFGVSVRSLLRRRRRVESRLGITLPTPGKSAQAERTLMARKGVAPEFDMTHPVAPGFAVKGTSTLYGPEGQMLQWVKTDQDRERMHAAMVAAVEAMADRIPREKPRPAPKHTSDDLLNCYVITDYHFGMLAWGEETGSDWDLAIAERMLVDWFAAAIAQSPPAKTGVFAQLGDAAHIDGFKALTPESGNLLDADTRFQKLVRTMVRVMRRVIGMLLEKHEQVVVLMAEGNHDMASSVWLRELMAALYEAEPRVIVDVSPDPYYCVEHGQTALFFHHGHKRGVKNVDTVFAAKFREVFGRTRYAYAHMGHLHHVDVKETNLMVVEQHQTLAARDAYASRGGWMSDRSAQVITYHRALGEVGRVRIAAAMFEARAA